MSSSSILDLSPVYGGSSNYQKLDTDYTGKRSKMDAGGQPKLSRLQQMQVQYQQKMLKDKEEKLITMFQDNQQRALNRVQSTGMAREFFRERREMEATGNLDHMPSIAQHYQQKRRESGVNNTNNYNAPVHINGTLSRHNSIGSNQSQRQHNQRQNSGGHQGYQQRYQKMSAGRDKSNPLAPIERTNTQDSEPFPRKPQIHGRPRTKDSDKKPTNETTLPTNTHTNGFSPDDSPPPNLSRLKQTQKQKMSSFGYGGRPPRAATINKPSDFQKWQDDRDQERTDRLRKHQQPSDQGIGGNFEYEDEKENESDTEASSQREKSLDIERKQKEIMEKIARQQAELERIRKNRAYEEEEDRKERQRRKKREEERRRKMKEEDEKRKREEHERRLKEEEEIKRKVSEQRKVNQPHTRYETQEGSEGYASHLSSYRAEPTPPPQPKPARKQPVRKPPQHHNPPTPSTSNHDNQAVSSSRQGDVGFYEQASQMEGAFTDQNLKLVKCSNCGRKFTNDRIDKHKKFCGNITKKRKVLDGADMRVGGTEMEKYVAKNGVPKRTAPPQKKSNWRKQHEEFINSIKYARKVSQFQKEGGDIRDLPPPPPSENADYVRCPHCARKFNAAAADRHIPRCQDIKAKPTMLKRRH